jgi:hypothetical protein
MSARCVAHRAALALTLAGGLGASLGALAVTVTVAPARASTEGSNPPSETEPTNCPSFNPPNQLTLAAGTPQTTTLETAFASGLQVALTNSDGCPVTGAAGAPVTFTGPASGAGGRFSASNSNIVTVGADASGTVAAPVFTANATAGSYAVTATSQYGSVSFSLTNTAVGVPAQIAVVSPKRSSASVASRYREPLQVRLLDAAGNPVAGATVTFTLSSASTGTCGASVAAGASFAGGSTQATATTEANGLATSPALSANAAAGSFTATAAVSSGVGADGAESAGKAGGPSVAPATFSLVNLAGKPAKIAPGVGSSQSTSAGSAFSIRLAVIVTDAKKNPVPGAPVTFSAPSAGASGHFTIRSPGRRHRRASLSYTRTVEVKTGACGIAVAPPFAASRQAGGYVVKASANPARPAAFALVNEAA